jgi:hypothetical protein
MEVILVKFPGSTWASNSGNWLRYDVKDVSSFCCDRMDERLNAGPGDCAAINATVDSNTKALSSIASVRGLKILYQRRCFRNACACLLIVSNHQNVTVAGQQKDSGESIKNGKSP